MSKTIYLQKHLDDAGNQYIWASDVHKFYKEYEPKFEEFYSFALIIERLFNYWNDYTPTAFGNPDHSYLQGQYAGYLLAKGYVEQETSNQIILYKGKRKAFVIDKINKPQSYYEAVKDNNETLNAIFGR